MSTSFLYVIIVTSIKQGYLYCKSDSIHNLFTIRSHNMKVPYYFTFRIQIVYFNENRISTSIDVDSHRKSQKWSSVHRLLRRHKWTSCSYAELNWFIKLNILHFIICTVALCSFSIKSIVCCLCHKKNYIFFTFNIHTNHSNTIRTYYIRQRISYHTNFKIQITYCVAGWIW